MYGLIGELMDGARTAAITVQQNPGTTVSSRSSRLSSSLPFSSLLFYIEVTYLESAQQPYTDRDSDPCRIESTMGKWE